MPPPWKRSKSPLLVLDSHLRILSANRAFYQTFRLSPERVEQVSLTDLDGGNWAVRELVASVDEIRTNGTAFEGLEVSHDFERIGPRVRALTGGELSNLEATPEHSPGARDVTERKFIDQRLLQAAKMQVVGQLASGVAHEVNNQAQAILGFSAFVHESLRCAGSAPVRFGASHQSRYSIGRNRSRAPGVQPAEAVPPRGAGCQDRGCQRRDFALPGDGPEN